MNATAVFGCRTDEEDDGIKAAVMLQATRLDVLDVVSKRAPRAARSRDMLLLVRICRSEQLKK